MTFPYTNCFWDDKFVFFILLDLSFVLINSTNKSSNQDQQQQLATPNNNSRTTANSHTDQTNSNEEELRRFISTFGELSLLVSRVSTLTQDFYQRLNRMVPNRASTSNLQTVDLSENMFSTLHTLSHALHNISNFQLTSNGGRPEIQIAGRNDMINVIICLLKNPDQSRLWRQVIGRFEWWHWIRCEKILIKF